MFENLSLINFITSKCNKYNSKILLLDQNGNSISYSFFHDNLLKTINFLENQEDLLREKNYSIISPNCVNYLYFLFGLESFGGSAVNLNPNLTINEILYRLSQGIVSVIITTSSIFNSLKEHLESNKIETVIIIDEDSFEINIHQIIKLSPKEKWNNPSNCDNTFLQFTGGTTGITKAAIITDENIIRNVEQLTQHFIQYRNLDDMRVLIAFPFYHIFSIVFNFLFFFSNGGCCILFKDLRNTDLIIKLINDHNVNFTVAVNTWYKKLMSHPDFERINFSSIQTSLAGGEYVPLSTKELWKQKTGKPLYSAYGLTETSSLAIVSPLDDTNIDDSIGVAIPNTLVTLLDENDNEVLGNNIPGEIALKGPQVTSSYFNNTEETTKAFHKGWFKTGDIAIKKNNKFFKIIDRKKDMISVSGNKAYPNEIEEVILKLEEILDVAAIGKKSNISGEEVAICIVTKDNAVIIDSDIFEHCRKFLSRFKVPKYVFRYNELPKTPIGKTDRKKLREQINMN